MATPASHTLYVKNINDKIKKPNLRSSLFLLFSQCGEVIDIHFRAGQKYRGQVWVIFKQISQAQRAVQTLEGRMFYGKPLSITFSYNKSDLISKADGTYVPPNERQHKRKAPSSDTYATTNPSAQQLDTPQQSLLPQIELQTTPSSRVLFDHLPVDVTLESLHKLLVNYSVTSISPIPSESMQYLRFVVTLGSVEDAIKVQQEFQNFKLHDDAKLLLSYVKEAPPVTSNEEEMPLPPPPPPSLPLPPSESMQ